MVGFHCHGWGNVPIVESVKRLSWVVVHDRWSSLATPIRLDYRERIRNLELIFLIFNMAKVMEVVGYVGIVLGVVGIILVILKLLGVF